MTAQNHKQIQMSYAICSENPKFGRILFYQIVKAKNGGNLKN